MEAGGKETPSCFSSSGIIGMRRNGGVKSTSNTCTQKDHRKNVTLDNYKQIMEYYVDHKTCKKHLGMSRFCAPMYFTLIQWCIEYIY